MKTRAQAIVDQAAQGVVDILTEESGVGFSDGDFTSDDPAVRAVMAPANSVLPDPVKGLIAHFGGQNRERILRDRAAEFVEAKASQMINAAFWDLTWDEVTRQGLGPLLEFLASPGWREWGGSKRAREEQQRIASDATILAGRRRIGPTSGGEDWRALNYYSAAAYPLTGRRPRAPKSVLESDAWRVLTSAFPDVTGYEFVLGAISVMENQGSPRVATGVAKLRATYASELNHLQSVGLFSRNGLQQSARLGTAASGGTNDPTRKVPSWASKGLPEGLRTVIGADVWFQLTPAQQSEWLRSRGYPLEYAEPDGEAKYKARTTTKSSGGGLGLMVALLGVIGGGVLLGRRGRRKRPGRRRRR